jgi:hypothetical protein
MVASPVLLDKSRFIIENGADGRRIANTANIAAKNFSNSFHIAFWNYRSFCPNLSLCFLRAISKIKGSLDRIIGARHAIDGIQRSGA